MQALLLVVKQNGPTMFARIGMMRALNRHVVREFKTGRKETQRGSWRGTGEWHSLTLTCAVPIQPATYRCEEFPADCDYPI
jgi:hypothetical protein